MEKIQPNVIPIKIITFKMAHVPKIDNIVRLISELIVLRIYVTFVIFLPCRNLEAGDNQSLKSLRRDHQSNPDLLLREPRT